MIVQFQGWFDHLVMPGMFKQTPRKTTTAEPAKLVKKLEAKEAKWDGHRDETIREVEGLVVQGWVQAYTDGSAKRVRGWMQAGHTGCSMGIHPVHSVHPISH